MQQIYDNISIMGNIKINKNCSSSTKKSNMLESKQYDTSTRFVLSDVSKEELEKRRISVYSFLL